MNLLLSLLAGLVFGLGLIASGMADPGKVVGFLDLAGAWDPSLVFVMGGGIVVGLAGFGFARRRTHSLLGLALRFPAAGAIDRRLVFGSALFGIGWGLAGICPGPGLVLMGAGIAKGWVFGLATLAGMAVFEVLSRAARR